MSKLQPEAALARTQAFARHVRNDDLAQLDAWLVVIADDLDEAAWRTLPREEWLRADAGIIHLRYRPRGRKTGQKLLALIGKGVCFDTGGTNLKAHRSMLDMHTDMEGSAVALGTLLALTRLNAGFAVDCWLAVTENRIGPKACKPQDVVTASNGVSIQVIQTDAEGRMMLADALALAARERPTLMLDFATLTGACVNALTERYTGLFTNRPRWHTMLERATSGKQ